MRVLLIVLGALLVLGLVFGVQVKNVYNDLYAQREGINGQWAQVDVALQRRADLIPNLVETVKGFAKQERGIMEAVAEARAGLLNARTPQEKIEANARLEGALGRLLLVVENYPNLKSNENFMRLQDELAGTENRIAIARRDYNERILRYNTSIGLFPSNLVAGIFGFQRNDAYFKTEPATREAPKVAF
ncbi:MAG: LemA family protein [Bryobacterales bacterium]|nr:LemA family protein [Bryobacterales bacterium]